MLALFDLESVAAAAVVVVGVVEVDELVEVLAAAVGYNIKLVTQHNYDDLQAAFLYQLTAFSVAVGVL